MTTERSRDESVREAMQRVLSAEQNARRQVEAAREQASQMQAEAREREQRIQEATQHRAQRVHQASQRATAARIRDLRREASEKMAVINYEPGRIEAVTRAAARLATRLTSPDSGEQ